MATATTPEPGACVARVLVTFASRHGATREIAAALARALQRTGTGRHPGVRTVLAPVQRRSAPRGFDAVVLGSPVYADGWLESARSYADAVAAHLCGRPTWLFSSVLTTHRRRVGAAGPSDSRDWSAVREWSAQIVTELARRPQASGAG